MVKSCKNLAHWLGIVAKIFLPILGQIKSTFMLRTLGPLDLDLGFLDLGFFHINPSCRFQLTPWSHFSPYWIFHHFEFFFSKVVLQKCSPITKQLWQWRCQTGSEAISQQWLDGSTWNLRILSGTAKHFTSFDICSWKPFFFFFCYLLRNHLE